ncbi:MAG: lysophospholipid acyltransferase family protein [Candidatus Binatia bacterium]
MFYLAQLFVLLVVTVPLAIATVVFGPFDPHGKRVYRINQFWTWLILRIGGISLNVKGLENLESGQQYVFMVNHQSNIDIPILIQSLVQFQLRWIAKKELLWVPLFGWAMWATKHITVDRSDPLNAVKSLERAKQLLAAGISIVVFPEGTRSRDGRLLPFKKGGFLLAAKTRTKIVPVTIIGSASLLPAGAWRLRRGTIRVFVDEPIATESYRIGKLRALIAQVRQVIAAHLDQRADPQETKTPNVEKPTAGNRRLEKLIA